MWNAFRTQRALGALPVDCFLPGRDEDNFLPLSKELEGVEAPHRAGNRMSNGEKKNSKNGHKSFRIWPRALGERKASVHVDFSTGPIHHRMLVEGCGECVFLFFTSLSHFSLAMLLAVPSGPKFQRHCCTTAPFARAGDTCAKANGRHTQSARSGLKKQLNGLRGGGAMEEGKRSGSFPRCEILHWDERRTGGRWELARNDPSFVASRCAPPNAVRGGGKGEGASSTGRRAPQNKKKGSLCRVKEPPDAMMQARLQQTLPSPGRAQAPAASSVLSSFASQSLPKPRFCTNAERMKMRPPSPAAVVRPPASPTLSHLMFQNFPNDEIALSVSLPPNPIPFSTGQGTE